MGRGHFVPRSAGPGRPLCPRARRCGAGRASPGRARARARAPRSAVGLLAREQRPRQTAGPKGGGEPAAGLTRGGDRRGERAGPAPAAPCRPARSEGRPPGSRRRGEAARGAECRRARFSTLSVAGRRAKAASVAALELRIVGGGSLACRVTWWPGAGSDEILKVQ